MTAENTGDIVIGVESFVGDHAALTVLAGGTDDPTMRFVLDDPYIGRRQRAARCADQTEVTVQVKRP